MSRGKRSGFPSGSGGSLLRDVLRFYGALGAAIWVVVLFVFHVPPTQSAMLGFGVTLVGAVCHLIADKAYGASDLQSPDTATQARQCKASDKIDELEKDGCPKSVVDLLRQGVDQVDHHVDEAVQQMRLSYTGLDRVSDKLRYVYRTAEPLDEIVAIADVARSKVELEEWLHPEGNLNWIMTVNRYPDSKPITRLFVVNDVEEMLSLFDVSAGMSSFDDVQIEFLPKSLAPEKDLQHLRNCLIALHEGKPQFLLKPTAHGEKDAHGVAIYFNRDDVKEVFEAYQAVARHRRPFEYVNTPEGLAKIQRALSA